MFLLGLVTAAPEAPARPVVEALNAIYDVYSDCEFAYDKPVFVELGFLKHLEAAQKGVRTLVPSSSSSPPAPCLTDGLCAGAENRQEAISGA